MIDGRFVGRGGRALLEEMDHADLALAERRILVHAMNIRLIEEHPSEFKGCRVIVTEGIFPGLPSQRTGEVVFSALVNRKGKRDAGAAFDAAAFVKDYGWYDELMLDYDTYDPTVELTGQMGVKITDPDAPWEGRLSTWFNGRLFAADQLAEVLPPRPK